MKSSKKLVIIVKIIICLLIIINTAACGYAAQWPPNNSPSPPTGTSSASANPGTTVKPSQNTQPPTSSPSQTVSPSPESSPSPSSPTSSPTSSPSPSPSSALNLVPYDGIVEHIFFHEVIAYPELAFDGDTRQKGYDTNMVTVSEYKKILESLYNKNYILVNMNDVWSEYKNENGEQRMKRNTLMLPKGKLPIIISFDDITFYKYMENDGFMQKLIVGDDGDIWATGLDPRGNPVTSQDLAVVPILDKFVREHPDFSLNGAKGCIALTGYEGILGYRTQTDKNNDTEEFRVNRMNEIARVRPVVKRLKETGWYFATHSYGHINIGSAKLDRVQTDARRWMDEVASLVGETKIFIYPFGERLDGGDVYNTGPAFKFYHELGFRLFASVGSESYSRIKPDIAAVICDRISIDGFRMRQHRKQILRFFDAADVFDPMRPSEYGNSW